MLAIRFFATALQSTLDFFPRALFCFAVLSAPPVFDFDTDASYKKKPTKHLY
jgi:hypothetical protein